ncbi:hypothetical protein RsTz2092_04500 [Deferribacterales bacterium RsTz2092]|nr:hypothetical protein AGMMS49941_08770 [Deferribacterales bacterium]
MIEKIQRLITENVRKLRRKHGNKQVELASALGVNRSFIAEVESFRRAYNIAHLNKIAKHYACRLYDIIPEYPVDDDNPEIVVTLEK